MGWGSTLLNLYIAEKTEAEVYEEASGITRWMMIYFEASKSVSEILGD